MPDPTKPTTQTAEQPESFENLEAKAIARIQQCDSRHRAKLAQALYFVKTDWKGGLMVSDTEYRMFLSNLAGLPPSFLEGPLPSADCLQEEQPEDMQSLLDLKSNIENFESMEQSSAYGLDPSSTHDWEEGAELVDWEELKSELTTLELLRTNLDMTLQEIQTMVEERSNLQMVL